ncbi:MAG: nucleotidyl transferase AbiEii/AbiGii toxin family protein [Bacteroidales bacterium]|nr:nucleotidyl transferase AbiEii/AbiGii toxin family protein [Bacteroidales bacterium]MDD4684393.1 nucleotidyl transferase AbiEii/AbiGii toxin family protein [Bacteroidales bacterium]
MSLWINLGLDERKVLIQQTAEKEGIPDLAVEKDWWVTIVLKALFSCSCNKHLLFKGGTSLSKGWNIIERFSEDIDIALDRSRFALACDNRTQINILRKESRVFIEKELMPELNKNLIALVGNETFEIEFIENINSTTDPTVINVVYKSILDNRVEYIKNIVKIEISCLSLSDPNEKRDISSLIYKYYPNVDNDSSCQINTVLPQRTFLEKIFLLHEEFQKPNPRTERMSRHLYDLEKLMQIKEVIVSLNDMVLYNTIVEHRKKFNKISSVVNSLYSPEKINIIPPDLIYKDWEKDYSDMKKSFIYGDSLSFAKLIERIRELQDIIRNLEN